MCVNLKATDDSWRKEAWGVSPHSNLLWKSMQIYLEKKRVGKLELDQNSVINNAIIDNLINPRKLLIMQYLSECPITSFEFLLCIFYAW